MIASLARIKLNWNKRCALFAGTMLSAIAAAPSSMAADNPRADAGAIVVAQAVVNPNDPQLKGKAPPPKGQPPATIQRAPPPQAAPPVQPKGVQAPPQQPVPQAQPRGVQTQPPMQPPPGRQVVPSAPGQQPQLGLPKAAPVTPPRTGAQQQPAQTQPPAGTPQRPLGVPKGQQPYQVQQPKPGLPKGPTQTQQTPLVQPGAPGTPPVIGKPVPGTPTQQAKPPQPPGTPAAPPVIGKPVPGAPQPPAAQQAKPPQTAPGTPGTPGAPVIGKPVPAAPQPPQGTAVINPKQGRVEELRTNRVERTEPGGRVVIQEPGGRVIVRESGRRAFIRHDETERFRHLGHDHRFEQRGAERYAYVGRPGGYQIITVTGPDGRFLRRVRRGPDGREVVLVNNAVVGAAVATGFILALAAPQILIPRERYIVNVAAAPPTLLYETLDAPPVVPLERAYALDEIRYNVNLRDRVRRLDLDAITFETGSWEITPEQYPRLEVIANAIRQVLSRHPEAVFMIEGHTDAVGNDVDNLSLSDRRAESVAVVLTEQFQIPPENLVTQGYGEQHLKVPTDGPFRENRRVAIRNISRLLAGR